MRWAHRVWAFVRGYWWLPCPICGRKTGAHEAPGTAWFYGPLEWTTTEFGATGTQTGVMVCRDCVPTALARNASGIWAPRKQP